MFGFSVETALGTKTANRQNVTIRLCRQGRYLSFCITLFEEQFSEDYAIARDPSTDTYSSDSLLKILSIHVESVIEPSQPIQ